MIPFSRFLAGGLTALAALWIAGAAEAGEYRQGRSVSARGQSGGHWQHRFDRHRNAFNRHAFLRKRHHGRRNRHGLVAGFAGPSIVYGIDADGGPEVVDRSTTIECYAFNPACGQPTSTFGLIEYDGRGRPMSQHFESSQPYAPPAFLRIP
jgi:hypothetical protein